MGEASLIEQRQQEDKVILLLLLNYVSSRLLGILIGN